MLWQQRRREIRKTEKYFFMRKQFICRKNLFCTSGATAKVCYIIPVN